MEAVKYVDNISFKNKLLRKLWSCVSFFLFIPFGALIFNRYRCLLLKIFGAKIGSGSIVYASSKIPAPWNLEMGKFSVLGPNVELHIGKVFIENKVTISQGAYLCTGSHDISNINKPFFSKDIIIKSYAWIAADCFIAPGVTVGEGAVTGARSAVFKDVDAWTVVGGNPAKFIKKRVIKE